MDNVDRYFYDNPTGKSCVSSDAQVAIVHMAYNFVAEMTSTTHSERGLLSMTE